MHGDNEVKNLFSPGLGVSFQGAQKLSSYLVRETVYNLERKVVSCGCGKKEFQVYFNVTETDSFTSNFTNKTCKINHLFNCSEKGLFYLLTCWVCPKQYADQMVDEFGNR